MKKLLLFTLSIIFSFFANAQIVGGEYTLSIQNIKLSDTLTGFVGDTSIPQLWQTGKIRKPFFSADTNAIAIMTDSVNYYPPNANNWFVVAVPKHSYNYYNVIISFWHRYQTNYGHAGGIVEVSADHGATWLNVKGSCNGDDGGGAYYGIFYTDSFYTRTDTLATGEPAFMGTRSQTLFSRFQLFSGLPVKSTIPPCFNTTDTPYVRFRFVSDTTTDTLAGWVIDSMQVRYDYYGSLVQKINVDKYLPVSPNPSINGDFIFPFLKNEESFNIQVFNYIGQPVVTTPYKHAISLSAFSKGVYYYKVTNGTQYYSGTLLYE